MRRFSLFQTLYFLPFRFIFQFSKQGQRIAPPPPFPLLTVVIVIATPSTATTKAVIIGCVRRLRRCLRCLPVTATGYAIKAVVGIAVTVFCRTRIVTVTLTTATGMLATMTRILTTTAGIRTRPHTDIAASVATNKLRTVIEKSIQQTVAVTTAVTTAPTVIPSSAVTTRITSITHSISNSFLCI